MPRIQSALNGPATLLVKGLSQESTAFLRELVQNAHDSIRLRQRETASEARRIDLFLNPSWHTTTIKDNARWDRDLDRGLARPASTR